MSSKTFFISDTHFGHKNIIKHAGRPFASVEEMDAGLISNWNNVVKHGDVVWHLGDFAWNNRMDEFQQKLNGTINLLRGNHDKVCPFGYPHQIRNVVLHDSYKEIKVDGESMVLSHYPILSWNGMKHDVWHLFGHSHGNSNAFIDTHLPSCKMLDVGVDSWAMKFGMNKEDYRPISLTEIREYMATKHNSHSVDHHQKPKAELVTSLTEDDRVSHYGKSYR